MIKKLIKQLTVPILDRPPVASLARHILTLGIPIFMVHRMQTPEQTGSGTSPDHLRRCLSYLNDHGYRLLSLEELFDALQQRRLPPKSVVFTMDDGYVDQAEIAAPIFIEYGCPLSFFVITDMLDRQLWPWDAKVSWAINHSPLHSMTLQLDDEVLKVAMDGPEQRRAARNKIRDIIKELPSNQTPQILQQLASTAQITWPSTTPREFQPMTWDDARRLEAQGVRFCPHTKSHLILSKMDRLSAKREILDSWQALRRELKDPLKVFCYPTGRTLDFGPSEVDLLQQEGFIGAVSTFPGFVETTMAGTQDIYRLPRFELPNNTLDFIQYCSWVEQSKSNLRWGRT